MRKLTFEERDKLDRIQITCVSAFVSLDLATDMASDIVDWAQDSELQRIVSSITQSYENVGAAVAQLREATGYVYG